MTHLLHVLPEIPFVKLFMQHRFIQCLELAQSEFLGEQFKADVMAFQLILECFDGSIKDAVVVEGKGANLIDVDPTHAAGKRSRLGVVIVKTHESEVANSDDSLVGHGAH